MFHASIPIILLLPPLTLSYGLHNWTFNKNIIPKNMKEFQEQTNQMPFSNPLTKIELESMLAHTEDVLPNFDNDVINQSSHRFEKIKAYYEQNKNQTNVTKESTTEDNILRVRPLKYPPLDKGAIRKRVAAIERALALMTQFVYSARYKLTYSQMLRTKYRTALEYKIGYCFALMRDIRHQQLALYSSMHKNFQQHVFNVYYKHIQQDSYPDFLSYFLIYEKIVKLDVDMKDLVYLVQHYIDLRVEYYNTKSTETSKTAGESNDQTDANNND